MQLPGEFFPFIEKKVVFCLVVGGVTPLPPLSGPTKKKTLFFYVCLPLIEAENHKTCTRFMFEWLQTLLREKSYFLIAAAPGLFL